MKISIRRGVFETNSSTNHTYTFSVEDKSTAKRGVKLDTFDKKAALIDWLFDESYPNDHWLLLDGILLDPYYCSDLSKFDDEFKQKLCQLLTLSQCDESKDLVEAIVDKVTEREKEFFANKDFSYMSKLEMKTWENIVCDLSEKERETLALKTALLMLLALYDSDGIATYRKMFFDLLSGKVDGDEYIEIEASSLCCRLISVGELREVFLTEVERLCGKNIETINESVGYIGFDGLLNDYYDFDVLSEQLGLKLTDYDQFVDSLDKFLTDESKIVVAD